MLDVFVVLFAAHVLADFVFQSEALVRKKKQFSGLFIHVLIVFVTLCLVSGIYDWRILAVVSVSHLLMDYIKSHHLEDNLRNFTIDQVIHIAVIVGVSGMWPQTFQDGFAHFLTPKMQDYYLIGLTLFIGLIVSVRVGSFVISKAMAPMEEQYSAEIASKFELGGANKYSGLTGASAMIGMLERSIIFMFIIIGQPTGVGFLIAAKSILRFSGNKSTDLAERRAEFATSEMIIIGTLMSFGWAILISVLTRLILNEYQLEWRPD